MKSRLQASLPPAPEAFSAPLPSSPLSSPQLAPQPPPPLSAVPQPVPLALAAGAAEDVSLQDSSSSTDSGSGSISAGDTSCTITAAATPNHKPPRQQQQLLPSFSRIAQDGVLKASDRHFPSLGATATAPPRAGKGNHSPSLKPQLAWGEAPALLPVNTSTSSEKYDSSSSSSSTSRAPTSTN